jgi:hypothetical protein
MTVYLLISLPIIPYIHRVGQNRMYTPYMTVYTVISLPMMPYVHREYMVVWSTLKYPVYIPVCQCGHVRVVSCQSVLVLMPLLVSCQIAIAINDSSKLGIKKRIKSVRSCQGCVMSVPTLTSVQVNVTACVMSEWSCQGCVLSCPCKGLVLKAVSFVLCGYTASELCNGLC